MKIPASLREEITIFIRDNRQSFRRKQEYFSDYYKNAMEIFNGQKPTPIGTPKENLGMWE